MLSAITRRVSPAINQCELTHLAREPIDYERACAQHRQYEDALCSLGIDVISLDSKPDLPDSVFVEDVALVLDECAIMLNPGASSRRPEVASVETALIPYRKLFHIQPPGTVDGGDILRVGKRIFVGLSTRSTENAIGQLRVVVEPLGYEVRAVNVTGCLHLKSAVTQVGEEVLLANLEWIAKNDFPGMQFIEVGPSEPYAANAVLVDGTIIYPSSFPKTGTKLREAGMNLLVVDADELAKAEGALTCCSLIFNSLGVTHL